jgi:hypothetical protein
MLHIHNGDSTAETMRAAGFPGEHIAFQEALAGGPTPAGQPPDRWRSIRSHYLAGFSGEEALLIQDSLAANDAMLAGASAHDEVILWFEHDLHCQFNLLYLLNLFAQAPVRPSRLSLICIDRFPGISNFKGLGQLTAQQMASLFDPRQAVTEAQLQLASRAWAAYCAPNPTGIEALLAEDTSALPYLHGALARHLARFPSMQNGLGEIENRLLWGIANGRTSFGKLYSALSDEDTIYSGLGDLSIWDHLKRTAEARVPLVSIVSAASNTTQLPFDAMLALTRAGEEVLAEKADFIALNGIDQWLGGVHLTANHLWRWDAARRTLTP